MRTDSRRRALPTSLRRRSRPWSEAALTVAACVVLAAVSLVHRPFPVPRTVFGPPAVQTTRAGLLGQVASGRKLLGVAPDGIKSGPASLDSFARLIGRQPDVVEFYQSFAEPFDSPAAAAAASTGALPLDSWGPAGTDLAHIASGSDDAYITAFADRVRDLRGPLALTVGHEMNAPWSKWWGGRGPTDARLFVAAWQRIHTIFARQNARNVIWVWTVNIEAGGAVAPGPYYPGAGYVDWIGVDGYFRPGLPTTFGALLGPTLADLRAHYPQPILVVETGALHTALRPGEIESAFRTVSATSGLIGFIWFDYDLLSTEGVDWRLDGDPPSVAAYRRNATAAQFALRTPVSADAAPYHPGSSS